MASTAASPVLAWWLSAAWAKEPAAKDSSSGAGPQGVAQSQAECQGVWDGFQGGEPAAPTTQSQDILSVPVSGRTLWRSHTPSCPFLR